MNRSFMVGSVLGAIVVTAGGAVAGIKYLGAGNSAQVISANELHKTIKTPRQECHDEQVTRTKAPKDTNRLAGTGIGAVVGGLLLGVALNLLGTYVNFVGADLRLPAALAVILGVLLFRPAGLFGHRVVKRV